MAHAIGVVHRMQVAVGAREGFVAFGQGLLDQLEFLARRGRNWGMAFRGGRFAISEADYTRIGRAMGLG